MRFKVVLLLNREVSGSILPISYQYELCAAVNNMLTDNKENYLKWLTANGLTEKDNYDQKVYSLSNLYVPRLYVQEDRMTIQVPRVQFWISFHHNNLTEEFVNKALLGRDFNIGDRKSRVHFTIESITEITPVQFHETMEYQTISPVSVIAIRANNSVEYLEPHNPYFAQFMVEELIERWERLNKMKYTGSRDFSFKLLIPSKRKAVTIKAGTPMQKKVIAYMLKFELTMDVALQELAYNTGIGNKIHQGFGYIELLYKD